MCHPHSDKRRRMPDVHAASAKGPYQSCMGLFYMYVVEVLKRVVCACCVFRRQVGGVSSHWCASPILPIRFDKGFAASRV